MARNPKAQRRPKRAQATRAHLREVTQREEDTAGSIRNAAQENYIGVTDRSVETPVNVTEQVANQSREAVRSGARAALSITDHLTSASYGGGLRLVEDAARTIAVYQKAGQDVTQNLKAVSASTLNLGRGLQRMQQAWLEVLDQAFRVVVRSREGFANSKSMSEFAEAQRRLYVEISNSSVEAITKLLQLTEHVAREANRPLEQKAGRPD